MVSRCTAAVPNYCMSSSAIDGGSAAVRDRYRCVSISDRCRYLIVVIDCLALTLFDNLNRGFRGGLSELSIFQGWIGNTRPTCCSCSRDHLVVLFFCAAHVRTGNKRQAPALFARVSRPPGREDYAVANAGRFDCSGGLINLAVTAVTSGTVLLCLFAATRLL